MTQRIPENFSGAEWRPITIMGNTMPPRPNDDDDDDEDEENDTEPDDDREPPVGREPGDASGSSERRRGNARSAGQQTLGRMTAPQR